MKIFICGQKSFGLAVLKALYNAGHEIVGIAPPPQEKYKDKMVGWAMKKNIPIISDCEKLVSRDVPDDTDLVISAHSHWIISQKIVDKCTYGGIGFHPSLLPRHRGQDAVRWTIHMRDYITGGTIYRLDQKCDEGDILLQKYLWVDPKWDYHKLWENLFPIGVDMVVEAVDLIEKNKGEVPYIEQNNKNATWEPSWDRPRLMRPELLQLNSGYYD